MYNYSLKVTYPTGSDTQYRRELLEVFGLHAYTPALTEAIGKLYKRVAPHFTEHIQQLRQSSSLTVLCENNVECFTILFSWDYFHETHQYLREILTGGQHLGEKKSQLLVHLEKK